jgi:PAS domain S-box-containing protein
VEAKSIRDQIELARTQVKALEVISLQRLAPESSEAPRPDLFDIYHDAFDELLATYEQIDRELHRGLRADMEAFRATQVVLIGICLIATVAVAMGLFRDRKRRRRDWEALTEANQLLEEDIERRERVEEALREREARFRAITENSADIIIIAGPDGRCKYVTPSVERLNGYTADRVIGVPPDEFVHPDDLPPLYDTLQRTVENPDEIVRIDEFRVRQEDGGWLSLEAVVSNQLETPGVEGLVVTCRDITERKRIQQELRRSEHHFRMLFEHANDAVFIHTTNGEIVDVNEQACRILQSSREDIIGRNLSSITSPDHQPDADVGPRIVKKSGSTRFRSKLQRADGTVVPVEISASLVDPEKRLIQGVATDITEHLEYEERLRENHARLVEAHRIARMGTWEYDIESGEMRYSKELLRLVDRPSDYTSDMDNVVARFNPGHREQFKEALRRAVSEGREFDLEARATTVAGRTIWGRIIGQPTRVDGRTTKLTGVFQDITDRKKALERLRESEQRLSLLFRHTPVAVIEWDSDFRVTDWNPSAESLFGYSRDEALGKHPADLIQPQSVREQVDGIIKQLLADDGGHRSTNENLTKDSRIIVCDWYNTPLCDESGKVVGVASMAVDVTAQRRYQAALEDYATRLARSNRELQDFASVASHDLQEPLRKVRAFGDRLADMLADSLSPKASDYLGRMQNAAVRMQVLIDDLLTFARVTSRAKPFEPVNLDEIVSGVLSDLEVRISELDARVNVEELPRIDADPSQMRQLMQNLIANALKFHRPGVPPEVSVSWRSGEDDPDIPVGNCRIQISDNGIGFEPEYAERIFAIFQRLHGRSEYEGTGVGLSVCRKIVERHGGEISAEGRPGEGAVFTIVMPLKQQQGEFADDDQTQGHKHPVG